ncbi:MAG: putative DCC family thiol-disulfide oxidoreductase YuxK [Parvicellaceae bacterium]|jgi:predicted DCC family thiol-disulfide oxidoreductase YuxK
MLDNSPILLYDGVCNLCNRSVQRVIKYERQPNIKFAALQSDFGHELLKSYDKNPLDLNSLVLVQNGKVYQKSRAVFKVAAQMKLPFPFIYFFWLIPFFIRDWMYTLVANRRYRWYGKQDECWIPTDELKSRFID